MKNMEIVALFDEMAHILEQRKDNPFKVRAYRRAALTLKSLDRPVEEFAREPHAGHPMDVGIFTPGIVYSIPMVMIGAWLIWRARRKPALAS